MRGFLNSFLKMHDKYLCVKDTDKEAKAMLFGVRGIVYALVSAAFLVLCYFAFGLTKREGISAIAGIVLLVFASVTALVFEMNGVYGTILQLRLNRRAIGFVSIAFQIAAVGLAVALVIVVNNGL